MVDTSTPNRAFETAVDHVGGQSALGRLIGRTQQAISRRLATGRVLWAEDVLTVERATGISRHRLRPDVYGPGPAEDAAA